MFCGSCMRDNTLVAALLKLGCDASLIPTYTPIRTDERNVSVPEVFFGGINVFLREKYRWYRFVPGFATSWLDSSWLLNWVGKWGMKTSARDLGRLTVSMLRGEHGPARNEVLRLADWLASIQRPDVINLSNVLIGGCIPTLRKRLPQAPILVTLQGDDLFLDDLVAPYREQALAEIRRLSEYVDGFLTFTDYYADFMSDFLSIPRERFRRAPLGLNLDDYRAHSAIARRDLDQAPAAGFSTERPLTVGYLARICPAKGLHLLVDAWLQLRKMPGSERVRLKVAGWLGAGDEAYFGSLVQNIRQVGAHRDFEHAGVLERNEKLAFLSSLDVLSVPTVYHEPKGLFVLEALASGTPVVQPAHGAFPEMLAATGGGVLVEPGNVPHLAQTLHELLHDAPRRRDLAAAGKQRVHADFHAARMAQETLRIYRAFIAARQGAKPDSTAFVDLAH